MKKILSTSIILFVLMLFGCQNPNIMTNFNSENKSLQKIDNENRFSVSFNWENVSNAESVEVEFKSIAFTLYKGDNSEFAFAIKSGEQAKIDVIYPDGHTKYFYLNSSIMNCNL